MTGFQTLVVQKLTASNNSNRVHQQMENSDSAYMLGSDLVSINLFDRNGKLRKHENQDESFSITFHVKVC